MNPLIAILWWLSLGAVAIGAFILGYWLGASEDSYQDQELPQSLQEERKP